MNTNVRKALQNAILIVGGAAALAALIWGGSGARKAPQGKVSPPRTEAQRATDGPFTYGTPAPRTNAQTRLTCYGATDYDSIGPVLRAYQDSDAVALSGLLGRGKAIELAKGTHVYVEGIEAGVATVMVESGYRSGEKCYVWGRFIE
jgi:hypothetical protein